MDIEQLLLPLTFTVGGLVVGLIVERIALTRFNRIAAQSGQAIGSIVAPALRGMPVAWFGVAGVYAALLSVPLQPEVFNLLLNALLVIAILSVTVFLSRIAVSFVDVYVQKSEGILPSASIFTNLTRLFVFVIGILIVLQLLGISITPILTALGVGGLAVALALQDTLSNLFAGLHILAARQIQPGNYIKLESGEEGYVADIAWRSTTIRALPNNLIVIPNSKLASAIVTNFDLPAQEMAVLVQVGVAYSSDLEQVERVTIDVSKQVMKEVPGGVPEFEPFIRYHTFADFSINFTVILRARTFVDQYLIKHEFVKRLHKRYAEEGIEIPFPIRTVYMKGSEQN